MPFNFRAYDERCSTMQPEELQRQWQHYTRLISGASTTTVFSAGALPVTVGVSAIGIGIAAPAIHNARKKRDIIQKHLQRHGTKELTRKRDILGPMAVSGSINLVTLGVTLGAAEATGADMASKAIMHAAADGAGTVIEEAHFKRTERFEAEVSAASSLMSAKEKESVVEITEAESPISLPPLPPRHNSASGEISMSEELRSEDESTIVLETASSASSDDEDTSSASTQATSISSMNDSSQSVSTATSISEKSSSTFSIRTIAHRYSNLSDTKFPALVQVSARGIKRIKSPLYSIDNTTRRILCQQSDPSISEREIGVPVAVAA